MLEKFMNSDGMPEEIQEFIKNKPSASTHSLYLCKSIDMDGNVVETKIGMNLVTNYGFNAALGTGSSSMNWEQYIDGTGYSNHYKMFLGNGCPNVGDTIDVTQQTLVSYFSTLGANVDKTDYPTADSTSGTTIGYTFPIEYDPVTKNITQRIRFAEYWWDYTTGNNEEYIINEFGLGDASTVIKVHGLIYDINGDKSSITKHPNTRLYIMPIHQFVINAEMFNRLYNEGIYLMANPVVAYSPRSTKRIQIMTQENIGDSFYKDRSDAAYTMSESGRVATEQPIGIQTSASNDSIFFENTRGYTAGFIFFGNSNNSPWDATTGNPMYNDWWAFTFDELPVSGYSDIKEIECENVFCNTLNDVIPNDTPWTPDMTAPSGKQFDWAIGKAQDTDNRENFNGILPCSQFNVSGLYLYNHDTKAYDIPVAYTNASDTYYMCNHWKVRLHSFVNHNGVNKHVFVFVNPMTQYKITGFDNSGSTLVATDAWWDTSTYDAGLITNMKSVPVELQQKRYYIIIAGTNQALTPIFDEATHPYHHVNADYFELTANGCPKNTTATLIEAWPPPLKSYCVCWPIYSKTYGYFLTNEDLIYYDISNKSLISSYKLKMDDDTQMDPFRRWITEDEDRIIGLHTRYYNPGTGAVNYSWHIAKDVIRIWTVGSDSTTPTAEDLEVTFDTSDDNGTLPYYSFTDKGYMVIQRRESNTFEAAIVDVYGVTNTDNPGTPTFHTLQNVDLCFALGRTTNCVYLNKLLTHDTTYVFDIYDMATKTVIDQFTLDIGLTFNMNAIQGWKNHIYIICYDTADKVYYYNMNTHVLELTGITNLSYRNMRNVDNTANMRNIAYTDECLFFGANTESGDYTNTCIILDSNPTDTYLVTAQPPNGYSDNRYGTLSRQCLLSTIGTTNNGKHLILSGLSSEGYFRVVDIGHLIDTKTPLIYPRKQCRVYVSDRSNTGWAPYATRWSGSVYILGDGVIILDGYDVNEKKGKIYYIPIECMDRMKVVGTTKHINSFNQPVRFWGKTFQAKFTNDLSRLMNQT